MAKLYSIIIAISNFASRCPLTWGIFIAIVDSITGAVRVYL